MLLQLLSFFFSPNREADVRLVWWKSSWSVRVRMKRKKCVCKVRTAEDNCIFDTEDIGNESWRWTRVSVDLQSLLQALFFILFSMLNDGRSRDRFWAICIFRRHLDPFNGGDLIFVCGCVCVSDLKYPSDWRRQSEEENNEVKLCNSLTFVYSVRVYNICIHVSLYIYIVYGDYYIDLIYFF